MSEKKQKDPKDIDLIKRAIEGDLDAFGDLYERYLALIYRYIRSRIAIEEDAEDLTEKVFLRVFQALDRYQDQGWRFSAYLYRSARNAVIDYYRQYKKTAPLEDADRQVARIRTLDETLIHSERMQLLEEALSELSAVYQEVIRLRILLELPTETVAIWMGRSQGATRVLLHRALNALRKRVGKKDAQ